ncbi:LysR family transcriptional regulator [Variovorax ginsengisoli]|uniref:DNA-binding transcriptional LysR family regulator n=1 Tax=Variovorax ginsengisoli TaxID=363844 RepID=A0ABT9S0M8_9BURK|nr:LysR family transcriptional regulator [Variovorax ginsengisoli]MDP9897906.1 DNA-binding transcriptional LysR family regulator [Variovorax ginsengisoli]
MSERLDGIEVFVAVVETGNFSAAADKLKLTRSAVGKSVARLEARLDTRLFHRTTRSHRLTEPGQSYYERCRRALDELTAAGEALEAGRQAPMGRVRLTMPIIIGRPLITPLLFELGERHAQLTFDISYSDRRVDLIEEGIDLAIRSGVLDDSTTLAARPLGRQVMAVYAAPGYLAEHPRPASFDELVKQRESHRFVGYARGGWRQPWSFASAEENAAIVLPLDIESRFVFDSHDVVMDATIAGWGLARLPVWMAARDVAAGRLVRVFEEALPFGYELNAVWPRMRTLPMKVRVVIDLLAERMPGLLAAGSAP